MRVDLRKSEGTPLGWVLRRAFENPIPSDVPLADPAEALACAKRHQLVGRIVSRTKLDDLTRELGSEVVAEFKKGYASVAVDSLRLEATVRQCAKLAAARGTRLLCLKGAALHLQRICRPGVRSACDVDLLVDEGRAEDMWHALVRSGWIPLKPAKEQHFHLRGLVPPGGGQPVELHTRLWGLSLDGGDSVRLADLDAARLVTPIPGNEMLFAPEAVSLWAHVLVHAFALHWGQPLHHCFLRAIGDLVDIEDSAGGFSDSARTSGLNTVQSSLPRSRLRKVLGLVDCLRAGDFAAEARKDAPQSSFLAYLLATKEDEDFRQVILARDAVKRWRRIGLVRALRDGGGRSAPEAISAEVVGQPVVTGTVESLAVRVWRRIVYLAGALSGDLWAWVRVASRNWRLVFLRP